MTTFWRRRALLAGAATIALIGGTPTLAAETGVAGADAASVDSVIVTGSRIARAGFQAPTPTTVIDATVLNASPQPNVAANLNQLPVLSNSTSPRTSGTGVGGGTQGANFLNLRGLGANRTLVL